MSVKFNLHKQDLGGYSNNKQIKKKQTKNQQKSDSSIT